MPFALLLATTMLQVASPRSPPTCSSGLEVCHSLMLVRSTQAADCLRAFIDTCPQSEDRERAEAYLDLVTQVQGTWHENPGDPSDDALGTAHSDRDASSKNDERPQRLSLSDTMLGGGPELVLTSALFGASQGFLTSAAVVSALRTPESESFPALVAMPALGALGGIAAAILANRSLPMDAGDRALMSSAMTLGTIYGVVLQGLWEWSEIDRRRQEVQRVPLRFAMVLSSSLLVAGGAAATAWGTDIDPGDVGLANSAALWSAVIGGIGMLTLSNGRVPAMTGVLIPLAASIIGYDAVLSLSPHISIQRPATWLIEAGGTLGLMLALGVTPVLNLMGDPGQIIGLAFTGGATLGVAAGVAACFLVDAAFDKGRLDLPDIFDRTALLPTPLIGRDGDLSGMGLAWVGRF